MNYNTWDYLRMVFMLPGGIKSPEQDQQNIAGNHIGNYHFGYNQRGKDFDWKLYISHPFEDSSGMFLQNWKDNLYGFYGEFKKFQKIKSILFEITFTKHMSGNWPHDKGGGQDNYFNNTSYQSGWSYYGRSIGTPYIPFNNIDNESYGVELGDNRLFAVNTGVKIRPSKRQD